MPISFLIFLCILSFFTIIICINACNKIKIHLQLLFYFTFIFLISWMIAVGSHTLKVEREEIVDYSEVLLPNGTIMQSFNYLDDYGSPKSINLNELFKTKLPPGMKIMIKYYKLGPYCGVYYDKSYVEFKGKLEIIPPVKE